MTYKNLCDAMKVMCREKLSSKIMLYKKRKSKTQCLFSTSVSLKINIKLKPKTSYKGNNKNTS